MKKQLLCLSALLALGAAKAQTLAPVTYPLAKDSHWNYLDNGSDQGATDWKTILGSNNTWLSGKAPLGYGDSVNTIISFGPNSADKYITYYFFRDVEIDLAQLADMVEFRLKRDDGAVVYVNGVEVFRDNMPAGEITYLTHSASIVDAADENRYFSYFVPKTAFAQGVNRVAVEIHNRDGQSSDIRFDMAIDNAQHLNYDCADDHISCFTSIQPTGQTPKMIIPEAHRFQILLKEGDAYMTGNGNIPGNHDFTGYIPIDGSSTNGYLSVNHENGPGGVSIVDMHFNETTKIWDVENTQPVDLYNNDLVSTNRNCSGGVTAWGTIITAEENTSGGDANSDGYQDLGWLVEIDPATKTVKEYGNGKQEKLWAMGRMNHENVAVSNDGAVAYYGEDGGTHCVYKFVPTTPGNLSSGNVYVLKLDLGLQNDEPNASTGTWIQVPNATPADRNNLSSVAGTLGGTNFNGVEDCEIGVLDGKVYFTSKGKNRIYRFADNGMTVSEFETYAGGMSYPITTANGTVSEPWADGNDNLTFDDKGNLWVCQDGGLNYIWVIRPEHRQNVPQIKLFASMPNGSEPTGLTFSPDYKFGFVSVQHPNGNNEPQKDALFQDVTFNASAALVFARGTELGIQAPVTDFSANHLTVQEGETVTFADLSTNNPSSWNWSFEGGTPATSTEQNPTVTYATAGTYNVTLTAANVAGSSQMVEKSDYIIVEEALGVAEPLKGKLSVYPNPTQGVVNIDLVNDKAEKVAVKVTDMLGRAVAHTLETTASGLNEKLRLNIEGNPGQQVFLVRVTVGNQSANYKIVKTN
ncbi:alkaline phosphatase PhoX [Flavobacterium sp.]|uniref:alkaline phosphatase PhoX n=1 Tax=Flavobacterium sp. TaxID=239 RepID=UPI0039E527A5